MIHCQIISNIGKKTYTFKTKVAILIPAYNEERHLPELLFRCRQTKPAIILVVDDCSTDRTAQVLGDEASKPENLGLLRRLRTPCNLGKQGAVQLGLQELVKDEIDAVALIDGDGQHDPRELPSLAALLENFDMVIGARSKQHMPWERQFSNWFVNVGFRLIGGVNFVDVQSGMRIYKKELARVLATHLPQKGGFALEHESLTVLARYAQMRCKCLKAAAARVSCSYGLSKSKIGPREVLQLLWETFHQAMEIRQSMTEPLWMGRNQ